MLAGADDTNPFRRKCLERTPKDGLCVIGAADTVTDWTGADYLLWGDSHADAMSPGFDKAAADAGKAIAVATHLACPPVIGIERVRASENTGCADFNTAVMAHLRDTDDFGTVILAARWALSVEGTRPGSGSDVILRRRGDTTRPPSPQGNAAVFSAGLDQTLAEIAATGRNIVIVAPVPELAWNVPDRLARSLARGNPIPPGPATETVLERRARTMEILTGAAEKTGATLLDPLAGLCGDQCTLVIGDRPAYADDDHLSATAARTVIAPLVAVAFDDAARR
nr:SGNH hydrolase domain-containing protein [Pseudoruegeria sp. HB172150]